MKRASFICLLLSMLLSVLLGVHAMAETDIAVTLLKPDEIRMYHNNTYTGDTIVVGRGRQTYLYFTAPEDGFTSVKLNLRNEWGAAWGQTSEGADKVWDTIYVRICTPQMVNGFTAPAAYYTEAVVHGTVGVDEQIDVTDLVKAHMDKYQTNEFVIELAGYYQINNYFDNGAWEGHEDYIYCIFEGSEAEDTWTDPTAVAKEDIMPANTACMAPTEIRMYADSTYIDGSIIVGRGRQTYLYFEAPAEEFDTVELKLRNDHGRAWGETAEGGAREYDLVYLRICTPMMVRGITVKPEYYTAVEVHGVKGQDDRIDITDLVKAHMEKHNTNVFIVELAGYYQINEYFDNGAWEGSEDYTYCIFSGTTAESTWVSPEALADVDPMTDYIPVITSETVAAGEMTFQHPGVLFSKTMLDTMVTKVRAKENPWYSVYLSLLNTNEGSLHPEIIVNKNNSTLVRGLVNNNTLYNTIRRDADIALSQAILYLITGNPQYRANALFIIEQFGSIQFLADVADEQIQWSLITYKLCATAEILRYSSTNDESLAWNDTCEDHMQHFLTVSHSKWDRATHFMNQHLMCVLAQTAVGIYQNDPDTYARGILRGTTNPEACMLENCNHVSCNRNRTGAISVLFRYNTLNALTGEAVPPTLQFAEMGRDMGHSLCDIAATSTFAMMTWIQDTKVDPVTGEVSTADDAVLIWDFLDERIMAACNLFYKYNLGYEIPWYPLHTQEGNFAADGKQEIYATINPEYREIGRTGDLAGIAYIYYRYYLSREDLDTDPDTMYLSMARANAYPEGNAQDWIGWVDLLYTPADAAPFDQKSQPHALSIHGENCTWSCDKTEAVFGDLISIHVTVEDGYTLQGATVTVNGVKLDVERNITYAGSDTEVKLVFGMPQEDAAVIITPVQK